MPDSGQPAVYFEAVTVSIGGRTVLEDISLGIERGRFAGIVGPNGAGKTTLLRTMLGLVAPSRGRVAIFGKSPRAASRLAAVGYVPQRNSPPPGFPASALDVALMGRLSRTRGLRASTEDLEAALLNLDRVGMSQAAERPVATLSGGEFRRVMLAQALAAGAELLVLDEPTTGLDLPAEQEFYSLLGRLRRELSLTVVAVSHDLLALGGQADELVCINRRMHLHGNPEEVVHSHAIQEAYSCEFDFIAGELARHSQRHSQEPKD